MNLHFCLLCRKWFKSEDLEKFRVVRETGHKKMIFDKETGTSHLIAKGMTLRSAIRRFPIPDELRPTIVSSPQQIKQAPVIQETLVIEKDIPKETPAVLESESDFVFEGKVMRWEKLYGRGIAKLSRRHIGGHHTVSISIEDVITYGSLSAGKNIRCKVALDPDPAAPTPIGTEIEIYQD